METKKRIGIWIRVSTDRQVEGDSPEHHKQRAQHYIDSKEGWQAIEVYQLDAMSGKSISEYAETKRMLADIRSGHITGLVFPATTFCTNTTISHQTFLSASHNEGLL